MMITGNDDHDNDDHDNDDHDNDALSARPSDLFQYYKAYCTKKF